MKKPSDIISITEAAEIIGVTPTRARLYVADGRLAARRIGKRTIVVTRYDAQHFKRRAVGRPHKQPAPAHR